MNQKSLNLAVGIIFMAVAVVHLLRIVLGWEAVIGGWQVPMWVSIAGLVATASLSVLSFAMCRGNSSRHYICTGGCGGVSNKPGVCNAIVCTRKGMPLEECYCTNGMHRK